MRFSMQLEQSELAKNLPSHVIALLTRLGKSFWAEVSLLLGQSPAHLLLLLSFFFWQMFQNFEMFQRLTEEHMLQPRPGIFDSHALISTCKLYLFSHRQSG